MPNTFYMYEWIWHVYEVYRRSKLQPNSVVSTQSQCDTQQQGSWAIQAGVASLWPSTAYKVCQKPFICMMFTRHVYKVDRRSQSHPNSVVSTQMWHTAEPWQLAMAIQCGGRSNDHPYHIKYAKLLLYVWIGSDMWMKLIGSPNHNLTVPCG